MYFPHLAKGTACAFLECKGKNRMGLGPHTKRFLPLKDWNMNYFKEMFISASPSSVFGHKIINLPKPTEMANRILQYNPFKSEFLILYCVLKTMPLLEKGQLKICNVFTSKKFKTDLR